MLVRFIFKMIFAVRNHLNTGMNPLLGPFTHSSLFSSKSFQSISIHQIVQMFNKYLLHQNRHKKNMSKIALEYPDGPGGRINGGKRVTVWSHCRLLPPMFEMDLNGTDNLIAVKQVILDYYRLAPQFKTYQVGLRFFFSTEAMNLVSSMDWRKDKTPKNWVMWSILEKKEILSTQIIAPLLIHTVAMHVHIHKPEDLPDEEWFFSVHERMQSH